MSNNGDEALKNTRRSYKYSSVMNNTLWEHVRTYKKLSANADVKAALGFEGLPPSSTIDEQGTPSLKKVNAGAQLQRLSAKTRLLIKKIRKNRENGDSSESEGDAVASRLPPTFERLVTLLADADSLLNSFRSRGSPADFLELRLLLLQASGQTGSLSDFQRIIALSPGFYRFLWREKKLALDFPSDLLPPLQTLRKSELDQRQAKLRKLLQKAVTAFKKEFLKSKFKVNEQPEEAELGKWDAEAGLSTDATRSSEVELESGFSSAAFEYLQKADLPARPGELVPEQLPQFLERLDDSQVDANRIVKPRNSPRRGILQQLKAKGLLNDLLPSASQNLTHHQKTELLREKLTEKIKEKENQRKKTEVYYQNLSKTVDLDEAKRVVELVKFYFTSRKVQNSFVVKVVEFVCKNFGKLKSFDESNFALKYVIGILPQWLRVVSNRAGDILKIDGEIELDSLFFELSKFYTNKVV